MGLKVEDLATLSYADLEENTVDLTSRTSVVSPESVERLVEAKLCNGAGALTEEGVKKATAVVQRLRELRTGFPFDKRSKKDHQKITKLGTPWGTGAIKGKDYMTNGVFWIYSKPYAAMDAKKASSKLRKASVPTLQKALKGKRSDFVELQPYWWMVIDLTSLEVIWMRDEDNTIAVPVQAAYFDFLLFKYPTAKFYIRKDKCSPVVAKVKNRGVIGDVVALVQPLIPSKKVPIPVPDEDGDEE